MASVDGLAITFASFPLGMRQPAGGTPVVLASGVYTRTLYSEGYADGIASVPPATIPVLSNLFPAPGSPVYPDTPLQFDLTDTTGFKVIIPMIIMDPARVPEPTARGVGDADFEFEGLYAGGSTRQAITGGYRYTLRRKGGWYAAPRLLLWAVSDRGGVWVGP